MKSQIYINVTSLPLSLKNITISTQISFHSKCQKFSTMHLVNYKIDYINNLKIRDSILLSK